jgi:uncharacterized protein
LPAPVAVRLKSDDMGDPVSSLDLRAVALFPLPNVVLFPHAVLPLHIFEQRYKAMTADALAGTRQVAMALLRPGWEKSYHGQAEIEPVVCVGRILSHEQLPDGKYNFLLQGHTRARIVRELPQKRMYRLAQLEKLVEQAMPEIELAPQRQCLTELFAAGKLAPAGLAEPFSRLLAGELPTADVADLIAFTFIEDASIKQSLLAETDVHRRVDRILAELKGLSEAAALVPPYRRATGPPSAN